MVNPIKEECIRLRLEERLSYKEIRERTGAAKGSLSGWLKNCPLTPEEIRTKLINSAKRMEGGDGLPRGASSMTNPAKINRTIAEKVMGWFRMSNDKGWLDPTCAETTQPSYYSDFDPYNRDDHAMMAQRALPEDKRHNYVMKLIDQLNPGPAVWHLYLALANATSRQRSLAMYEVIKDDSR